MNKATATLLLALACAPAQAFVTCGVASGTSLSFGSYDIFASAPDDSQANVVVTCRRFGGRRTVSVAMHLDQGTGGTAVNARAMRFVGAATDKLAYGLYRDMARSSNWGVTDGVDTVSQSATINTSATLTFSIYGRIPPGQDVSAGNYTDTVRITILY